MNHLMDLLNYVLFIKNETFINIAKATKKFLEISYRYEIFSLRLF